MRWFASFYQGEFKERFRVEGVKAGETEGMSGGKPVILVQGLPFPPGSPIDMGPLRGFIIEFWKDQEESFVDDDDGVEASEQKWIGWEDMDYSKLNKKGERAAARGECFYGSYVKEIRPEEIIAVHTYLYWEDEKSNGFDVDGKDYLHVPILYQGLGLRKDLKGK